MVYITNKIAPMKITVCTLEYSPSASPSASVLLHVNRYAWRQQCDLPSRNTAFNSPIFNNENTNCNALNHWCFWLLILSILNNTWLIKWTHFLWWFLGGKKNYWTNKKKKGEMWQLRGKLKTYKIQQFLKWKATKDALIWSITSS